MANSWLSSSVGFDQRYLARLKLTHPIIQAPMAGANDTALTLAVCSTGGLGGLPAGMLSIQQLRQQLQSLTQTTNAPFAVNFFCHQPPPNKPEHNANWLKQLQGYYAEYDLGPTPANLDATRHPFAQEHCELLLEYKPAVVSFHYGLPTQAQVQELNAAGCLIQSTATTVAEARWLEDRGADVIIAQGLEAGGHRGHFLSQDLDEQLGTMALLPQVADAVAVPVIAAGGIADARGIAAALHLGACAVQLGTAYLFTQQASISAVYQQALLRANAGDTRITNVISGRPARGLRNRLINELGPTNADAPAFPLGSSALAPLRQAAESQGQDGFSPLWAGQNVETSRRTVAMGTSAVELTNQLADSALLRLGGVR